VSFSESAPENLGHGAVGEAERERHRLEPAVRARNPHAPGNARAPGHATPLVTAGGLIVSGALRRRQDLSDACAGYLPDLLRSGLVLLLGETRALQGQHLLATVLEDQIDLGLLLGREAKTADGDF